MAELIETKLGAAGLKRYEISNYARPWFQSRHNVNYWRAGDYLGLGAGAHSYKKNPDGVTGKRWSDEKNPGRYMSLVAESNHGVIDREEIDFQKAAGEFMFLGLRLTGGISVEVFRTRFGRSPEDFYPRIKIWKEGGFLKEQEGHLKLTQKV